MELRIVLRDVLCRPIEIVFCDYIDSADGRLLCMRWNEPEPVKILSPDDRFQICWNREDSVKQE